MIFYKDSNNTIHALDSIEFEHLLPTDCISITDGEAQELQSKTDVNTNIDRLAEIDATLTILDTKKIRAISDAILLKDTSKLEELEEESNKLRLKRRKLMGS